MSERVRITGNPRHCVGRFRFQIASAQSRLAQASGFGRPHNPRTNVRRLRFQALGVALIRWRVFAFQTRPQLRHKIADAHQLLSHALALIFR